MNLRYAEGFGKASMSQKYALEIAGFEVLSLDTEEIVNRVKANLQAKIGDFLKNDLTLYAIRDKLGIVAKSPNPNLKEPVRIASENYALLVTAQKEIMVKAQAKLDVFTRIQADMARYSKATILQKLLTTASYGTRFPQMVKEVGDIALQVNDQNTKVKKLYAEVAQLEKSAKGQGIIPAIGRITSPLYAGVTGIIKTAGLPIALAAGAVLVLFFMSRRK